MILILIYGNEKKTFETLKNQGIPHFSTGHVFGMELHFISLGFGMVFPDMRSFGMVSPKCAQFWNGFSGKTMPSGLSSVFLFSYFSF